MVNIKNKESLIQNQLIAECYALLVKKNNEFHFFVLGSDGAIIDLSSPTHEEYSYCDETIKDFCAGYALEFVKAFDFEDFEIIIEC